MVKRDFDNPYVPGDFIPDLGIVNTNHCGLPWACGDENVYCGCITIVNKNGVFDALDGRLLSFNEVEARKGNLSFDYGKRMQGGKRPQRELDAISQSINDRQSFISGKKVTFLDKLKWKLEHF
jgi:hypothetical protein